MSPVPEPSACTCCPARESFTSARGPSCVPPEYVMSSSCHLVDGSVMQCPLMSSEPGVGTVLKSILRPAPSARPSEPAAGPGHGRTRGLRGGRDHVQSCPSGLETSGDHCLRI